MEKNFSFDHLDETEFENFCYDLLHELGFVNINWRKGTGKSSSPSDGGRDIECELEVEDIDGKKYLEKWFVECKHYKEGVPFKSIQGVLAAATSNKPDTVLIIASNFLSNPAKNDIEGYIRENKPPFRIKYWEKPDLEKLTLNTPNLLKKYNISNSDFSFLKIMHPAHLLYVRKPTLNTLNYFFELVDSLNSEKRDKIFYSTYHMIINPRWRKPTNLKGKVGDLIIDEVNYSIFKEKTYYLAELIPEDYLVFSIVSFTLREVWRLGDKTSTEKYIKDHKSSIKLAEKSFLEGRTNEKSFKMLVNTFEDMIQNLPKQTDEYFYLYIYFCEKVISELFKEDILKSIDLDSLFGEIKNNF